MLSSRQRKLNELDKLEAPNDDHEPVHTLNVSEPYSIVKENGRTTLKFRPIVLL